MPQSDPIQIQRQYYAQTASSYDQVHVSDDDEHAFALHWLSSLISAYSIQSVLDVGSGTGRAINFLNARHPELKVIGLEPVAELRAQGYAKGIAEDCLWMVTPPNLTLRMAPLIWCVNLAPCTTWHTLIRQ